VSHPNRERIAEFAAWFKSQGCRRDLTENEVALLGAFADWTAHADYIDRGPKCPVCDKTAYTPETPSFSAVVHACDRIVFSSSTGTCSPFQPLWRVGCASNTAQRAAQEYEHRASEGFRLDDDVEWPI
jgi:hypothetical protein